MYSNKYLTSGSKEIRAIQCDMKKPSKSYRLRSSHKNVTSKLVTVHVKTFLILFVRNF